MRKLIPGVNDLATLNPTVAAEWNTAKNRTLTPQSVFAYSGKKVWWKCSKGHEWEARIESRVYGNGCPYCAGQKPIPGETDLATMNPELIAEWNFERNCDLTPSMVSPHSRKMVWWKCIKGHEWITMVHRRTRGLGCPICSGRSVLSGFNDLNTIEPALASEWHPTKNGKLTAKDITIGSGKKVWWQCEKGHEWEAIVVSRVQGSGCPYCAGFLPILGETDLATVNPRLAAEWHPIKNGDLTPQGITARSFKKVWWQCSEGHEWEARIVDRTHNNGCPYCAGFLPILGKTDLATVNPTLTAEWHPDKNGGLTPQSVTAFSHKEVWWKCSEGHEWKARIGGRSYGNGCPFCSGSSPIPGETDLATLNPILAAEWHPTKNKTLTPRSVTAHSDRQVWWRCSKGHEWKATVKSRSITNSCPFCAGRRAIPGETDLATTNPNLVKEWDFTKNGKLTPNMVTTSSSKKVWWTCSQNHHWRASISARHNGSSCPFCAGRTPYQKRFSSLGGAWL